MPKRPRHVSMRLSAITVLVALVACGPQDFDDFQPPPCQGKCDGLSSKFKDLFSDMRKVDLGDLVNVGAKLATEQVNDQLGVVPYSNIELSPTELYTSADQAGKDLTLHNIETLHSGLTARYGQKSFVSHISGLRVDYLKKHPNRVFAEAQFQVEGKLSPRFKFDAGGLPGYVGFLGAKGVKTTIIAPFKGELKAVAKGPLQAIKNMRGFVLPRDVDDMEAMTPGETVAMTSDGVVGLNIGVGLPIYITTIESIATLHAVISAALRATLSGALDIQIIRDSGKTVMVDVGLTGQTNRFAKLAVKNSWGVEGLGELTLEVGPLKLDVAEMAEKALEDLLNRKLSIFSAAAIKSEEDVRHTVARFAFDLSQRDKAMEQALVQATRGDIRLAQALANRPQTGVTQLLDLTRDARSISSYLGLHFLSMKFYRQKNEKAGQVVITTGKDSQQILFNELDKEGGLFFTSRGYKRRSVVSLMSHEGRLIDADFNLRVQLRESDKYTERNQVLDHVDPLLALFIGKDNVAGRIAPITDEMARYIDKKCPVPSSVHDDDQLEEEAYKQCMATLPGDPKIASWRDQAKTEYQNIVAQGIQGGFGEKFDDASTFAEKLFNLKLAVQSAYEYPAWWTGPKARMNVDYRLTEKAISSLLMPADGPDRYAATLKNVLHLLRTKRHYSASKKSSYIQNKLDDLKKEIKQSRDALASKAFRYRRLNNLENVSYASHGLGQTILGKAAHLLLVDNSDSKPVFTLGTVAERKAVVATELFDKLVDKADFGVPAHQAIGYALLASMHPSELELLIDLHFKKDKHSDHPDTRLYGRGDQAQLIDAGQFDLEALIGH